jgi:hypothetical protein
MVRCAGHQEFVTTDLTAMNVENFLLMVSAVWIKKTYASYAITVSVFKQNKPINLPAEPDRQSYFISLGNEQ